MQRLVLVIVTLVVIGGLYLLISQSADEGGGTDPLAANGDEGESGAKKKKEPAGLKSSGVDPDEVLVPQVVDLPVPARVLMVGHTKAAWSTFLGDSLKRQKDLSYVTWWLGVMKDGAVTAAPGAARGLEALKTQPTGAYLDSEDIKAVIWDQADPNAFPISFWNVVAERVNNGSMGLYFRPSMPLAPPGSSTAPTQHPALTHPVLKALLPVARASLIKGSPTPGLFTKPQPLAITEEGSKHVATRLVKNTDASLKTWAQAGEGKGALATLFCYPVLEAKSGAQVLLNVEAATKLPAVIVSGAPNARVLWMGNVNFGKDVYFARSKDAMLRFLTNAWIVWLVGQAAE